MKGRSAGFSLLCATVQSAVAAVFADQSLALEFGKGLAPAPTSESYVATVGFASEVMRGAVSLLVSGEVLRSILPDGLDQGSAELLADYLGELANMTAGRLKRQLLLRDVVVLLSTPTCSRATTVAAALEGESSWLEFDSARGPVCVRVDAMLALDFALKEECQERAPMAESDAIFF
jgi:CheY-specific phosphatase CheX